MNYTQSDIEAVILKLEAEDVEKTNDRLWNLRKLLKPAIARAQEATEYIRGMGAPNAEMTEINFAAGALFGLMLNNNEEWIAAPSADQKLDQFIRVVAAMGNA